VEKCESSQNLDCTVLLLQLWLIAAASVSTEGDVSAEKAAPALKVTMEVGVKMVCQLQGRVGTAFAQTPFSVFFVYLSFVKTNESAPL